MQLHGHHALLNALRVGAAATDLRQLGAEPLDAARRAVRASSAALFEFGAQGLQVHAGGLAEPFAGYRLETAATDVIFEAGRRWGNIPTPVVVNGWEGFDERRHRRSAAYADFYRPAGVEQLVCIHLNALPFGAPGLVGVLLTRSRTEEGFGSEDLEIARACAMVFRGTVQRLSAAAPDRREGPMLMVDAAGRLAFLSASAEPFLRAWRGALPAPLAEAMASYRAFLNGESLMPARMRVTLEREPAQGPVICDLFAAKSAAGEPLVGATLSEEGPTDRVAAAAARCGLTRTEAAVLRRLVEGRKNAAIAAAMGISLETVKTHVQRIFGKLGVRSRTEAAHLVLSRR